ncbi:MAG: hypothetical protein J6B24_10130, partial [Clostridia bacterium]|nr:hypothetical protein [Clostridia bacterium]
MRLHPAPMPLCDLLTEAGIPVPESIGEVTVKGLSSDSRKVTEGDLFIAIDGLHTDARDHIPEAVAKGASAIICEAADALPDTGRIPLIPVPNARAALASLFDGWYDHPANSLRLVAVTGTNGKTSVSTMLYTILRASGVPCGLIGTVGCRSTAGDAILCGVGGQPYSGMTTPDPAELYPLLARMA